jgi:hypothetical protein
LKVGREICRLERYARQAGYAALRPVYGFSTTFLSTRGAYHFCQLGTARRIQQGKREHAVKKPIRFIVAFVVVIVVIAGVNRAVQWFLQGDKDVAVEQPNNKK